MDGSLPAIGVTLWVDDQLGASNKSLPIGLAETMLVIMQPIIGVACLIGYMVTVHCWFRQSWYVELNKYLHALSTTTWQLEFRLPMSDSRAIDVHICLFLGRSLMIDQPSTVANCRTGVR